MKKSIFLTVLLCAFAFTSMAQTTRTTSYVRSGQDATLDLNWTMDNYGEVQWQESTDDGETWTDISGATKSTYTFKTSEPALYRAHIVGDPACPEVNLEREIVPLTFNTSNINMVINGTTFCSAEMAVTGLDVISSEIVEYGFLANLSSLSRSYDIMPFTKVGETIEGDAITFDCMGLMPNQNYAMRFYFKTADGSVLISASRVATTTAGLQWSSENWTITTTTLRGAFTLEGSASISSISVSYGTSLDNLTSTTYTIEDGTYYTALLSDLEPAQTYVFQVTASVGSETQTITREIRTFTDYSTYEVDETVIPVTHTIVWDEPRTLTPISDPSLNAVEYPRVCRMANGDLLLTYHGGTPSDQWLDSYYRISHDNGVTWDSQVMIFDNDVSFLGSGYWRICNPQATVLSDGTVILSVIANANPETNENCKVLCTLSKDNGRTWSDPIIVGRGRAWEPHVVELPGGELELLVSSEAQWWNGSSAADQEIVYSRSTDGGHTWTAFQRASYFATYGGRDGMPVPIVMQGNKGVLYITEVPNGGVPPSFVHRNLAEDWEGTAWDKTASDYRWSTGLTAGGCGPYIIQLPTGEIVASCHTGTEGLRWQVGRRPQVGIADSSGHNFTNISVPLTTGDPLTEDEGAYYNSLFQIDENHIWLIVTHVEYSGSTRGASSADYLVGTIVEQ